MSHMSCRYSTLEADELYESADDSEGEGPGRGDPLLAAPSGRWFFRAESWWPGEGTAREAEEVIAHPGHDSKIWTRPEGEVPWTSMNLMVI